MKDDLTQDELKRLYDIIHAGKLPGLSEPCHHIDGTVSFESIQGRCYLEAVWLMGKPGEALAIIALETSLAEVARERGTVLAYWLDRNMYAWDCPLGPNFESTHRPTALARCCLAAFEGVEL